MSESVRSLPMSVRSLTISSEESGEGVAVDGSDIDPSKSLLGLPNELLHRIVRTARDIEIFTTGDEHLPSQILPTLRLVCGKLRHISSEHLFMTVTVKPSLPSVERLEKIAMTEYLSRHVTTVRILMTWYPTFSGDLESLKEFQQNVAYNVEVAKRRVENLMARTARRFASRPGDATPRREMLQNALEQLEVECMDIQHAMHRIDQHVRLHRGPYLPRFEFYKDLQILEPVWETARERGFEQQDLLERNASCFSFWLLRALYQMPRLQSIIIADDLRHYTPVETLDQQIDQILGYPPSAMTNYEQIAIFALKEILRWPPTDLNDYMGYEWDSRSIPDLLNGLLVHVPITLSFLPNGPIKRLDIDIQHRHIYCHQCTHIVDCDMRNGRFPESVAQSPNAFHQANKTLIRQFTRGLHSLNVTLREPPCPCKYGIGGYMNILLGRPQTIQRDRFLTSQMTPTNITITHVDIPDVFFGNDHMYHFLNTGWEALSNRGVNGFGAPIPYRAILAPIAEDKSPEDRRQTHNTRLWEHCQNLSLQRIVLPFGMLRMIVAYRKEAAVATRRRYTLTLAHCVIDMSEVSTGPEVYISGSAELLLRELVTELFNAEAPGWTGRVMEGRCEVSAELVFDACENRAIREGIADRLRVTHRLRSE